jgi:acyl-CoA thioester hydrolase
MTEAQHIAAPLELTHTRVLPAWIDYNRHMMDGYYAVAFSHATDKFMDYAGMDAAYRATTRGTLYTAEMHLTYLRELKEGATLRFTTQLLGSDAKRIHLFHCVYDAAADYLAATSEWMLLHVDQALGRVAAMPEQVTARLAQIAAAHATLPRPAQAGHTISMARARMH